MTGHTEQAGEFIIVSAGNGTVEQVNDYPYFSRKFLV